MLYKTTQICFNESLYSIMNIITKNETKLMYKMPQYWFEAIIMWNLLEKGYYKPTVTDC